MNIFKKFNPKDFDLFVFDSNNWKEQEDVFFGFKTINESGNWLKLNNFKTELIITMSKMPPCLFIYEKDTYFAISNSFKLLIEYLNEHNKILTDNKNNYLYKLKELKLNWTHGVYDNSTLYKEVNVVPFFTTVIINDSGIILKTVEDSFEKNEIKNFKEEFDNQLKIYNQFIKSKLDKGDTVIVDLSGGVDTRILYLIWRNLLPTYVYSKPQKNRNLVDDYHKGIDYSIAYKLLSDKQKEHLAHDINMIEKDCPLISYDKNVFAYFKEGNSLEKDSNIKYSDNPTNCFRFDSLIYQLTGAGGNDFRIKSIKFNEFWMERRITIQSNVYTYYTANKIRLAPFLQESAFLNLKNYKSNLIPAVILLYKDPELLNIPFAQKELYYFDDKIINEARNILNKYWKG